MSWDMMAHTNHVNRVTSPLRVRTMLYLLRSAADQDFDVPGNPVMDRP